MGFLGSNAAVNRYDALSGGWADWALKAIMGMNSYTTGVNTNDVAGAMAFGWPAVLCTGSSPGDSNLVGDHCYAVVSYNIHNSLPFGLYNPWGPAQAQLANVYGAFFADANYLTKHFHDESLVRTAGRPAGLSAASGGAGGASALPQVQLAPLDPSQVDSALLSFGSRTGDSVRARGRKLYRHR
jgi:hypothetical protein